MPARDSLTLGGLPIGLAHGVKLKKPITAGALLTWSDVAISEDSLAIRFRRAMEKLFREEWYPETAASQEK